MQLTVRKDQSEQFLYNCAKFPAFFGHGHTSVFPNHTALAHWHDDIESSIMLSGRMNYNVNGEIFRLNKGDGIFVNTRQIYYNFSENQEDGEYLCILLHPMLLCASQYVEDAFVAPVLENPSFSCQVLRQDCEWAHRVCKNCGKCMSATKAPGHSRQSRQDSFRFGRNCSSMPRSRLRIQSRRVRISVR